MLWDNLLCYYLIIHYLFNRRESMLLFLGTLDFNEKRILNDIQTFEYCVKFDKLNASTFSMVSKFCLS